MSQESGITKCCTRFTISWPSVLPLDDRNKSISPERDDLTEIAERLKPELAQLSAHDRAALAHFLIHSLDEDEDADAEAAWDAELALRAEEIKSGKAIGEPAAKVFADLREKYS